jgi:hypothetical protein
MDTRGQRPAALVRRHAGRHEQHAFERQVVPREFGECQVPHVRRIEGPAEQAETPLHCGPCDGCPVGGGSGTVCTFFGR